CRGREPIHQLLDILNARDNREAIRAVAGGGEGKAECFRDVGQVHAPTRSVGEGEVVEPQRLARFDVPVCPDDQIAVPDGRHAVHRERAPWQRGSGRARRIGTWPSGGGRRLWRSRDSPLGRETAEHHGQYDDDRGDARSQYWRKPPFGGTISDFRQRRKDALLPSGRRSSEHRQLVEQEPQLTPIALREVAPFNIAQLQAESLKLASQSRRPCRGTLGGLLSFGGAAQSLTIPTLLDRLLGELIATLFFDAKQLFGHGHR